MNETIDNVVPYKGPVVYEHIGEQFGGEIISILEAHELQPELVDFLNTLRPRINGSKTDHLILVKENRDDGLDENIISVHLFTSINSYRIVCTYPTDTKKGSLSSYGNCRVERAGERWTRGSDLAEGDYTWAGWHKVILDLFSYELVNQEALELGSTRMAFEPEEIK